MLARNTLCIIFFNFFFVSVVYCFDKSNLGMLNSSIFRPVFEVLLVAKITKMLIIYIKYLCMPLKYVCLLIYMFNYVLRFCLFLHFVAE